MSRKLRRHSHLRGLDASSHVADRASPCQLQGAFRKSRNGFPYCDLSIWGGIHQSKMPSLPAHGSHATLNPKSRWYLPRYSLQ